jgi:hypothetical protein
MRQHIDLAWLREPAHQVWVKPALTDAAPVMQRIDIHELAWLEGFKPADDASATPAMVCDSTRLLARSVVQLRRYDALLLTVSVDNLAWARQSLAALPKSPIVPIIALVKGLRSGALVDLLELGLADFVRWPACGEEFRARLIMAVCRAPRYIPLRESRVSGALTQDPRQPDQTGSRKVSWAPANPLRLSELSWPLQPYRESRQRIIDLFERQYLRAVMRRCQGNISQAARLAQKDRRTFWGLLRRHGISADDEPNLKYNR